MDQHFFGLTKLGFGALTFNSALVTYNSWGDAGSVAFVLAADAALLLLFLCLRELEQAQRGAGRGRDAKIKAAAWALTTLLTAMFASGVAPTIMPLAVGALVLLCLREVDHIRIGEADDGNMDGQYCALAKVGFAVLTCNSAVDAYHTRRDPGLAVFVLLCYAVLVIMTGLFIRAVARGHAGGHGQR